MSGEERSLPQGWAEAAIGDVCDKCDQRIPEKDEKFIYVDISSVNRDLKIIENAQEIDGASAPSRARKSIKVGDVLVSMTRPNLNAVALVDEPLDGHIASTGFEVLRPVGIDSRLCFYVVRTGEFVSEMSGLVQGALYPAVNSSDVRTHVFPLAPLAEQKVIADTLDGLLAQVDTLQARLDAIPAILKRFRQSVLSAAVTGKLTEEWRGGSGFGIECVLGDVCKLVNGYAYSSSDYKKSGIPLVRISDIDGVHSRPSTDVFVDSKLHDDRYVVSRGDCLVAMSGATTGKIGMYDSDVVALQNQRVGNIKIIDSYRIVESYRDVLLRNLSERFLSAAYGGAQPNISGKQIESFKISLPPLPEQHEIVRRVEELFAYADQIEKRVEEARSRAKHLTQSILAKAFRGELTAQWRAEHPELVTGENSAQALLERIRTARAQAPEKGKRGRQRKA